MSICRDLFVLVRSKEEGVTEAFPPKSFKGHLMSQSALMDILGTPGNDDDKTLFW